MKIVISADIEGASGVVTSRESGYPRIKVGDPQNNPDYMKACERLTNDINAAVEGAIKAGADEFVVHDSHGHDYTNILLEKLHPSVEVIKGMPIVLYEHDDLAENSYDASFLIGMHARAGLPGVLSHIIDWPTIKEVRINGEPVGESQVTAALAGYFGYPTVLITGDDVVCEEMKAWTNGMIETAEVKKSYSRYAARCLSLEKSRKVIYNAAYHAVKKIGDIQPITYKQPVTLEIDFLDRQVAKYVSMMPKIDYNGNCTVRYQDEDFLNIFKAFLAMIWLGHL
jgi:D-amino peptidase